MHKFPGHPELPNLSPQEEAYFKAILRKGHHNIFEIREEVSMLRRITNPRIQEIATIQQNTSGRMEHVLVYLNHDLTFDNIPIDEFCELQDYFNQVEAYLRYEMKKRKYRSVKKYGIYPHILEFSRNLSIDPAENL